MNHYNAAQRNRKLPKARSTFMKIEEIEQERARSGWDPYRGETEGPGGVLETGRERTYRENNGLGEAVCPPCGNGGIQPAADYTQIMQEQQAEERDRRRLQSMYPQTAKLLLPAVEEVCDQMEYEGSMMFDEYPDRTTIYRLRDQILVQMQEKNADEGDLIQVMLLDEIHQRRCRHNNCCKQTPCSI